MQLVLHLQGVAPNADLNAVWQNQASGRVGGFALAWAASSKGLPDTYTYRTRLVPGDYRLGVYESGLVSSASIGAVVNLNVPSSGGRVNVELRARRFTKAAKHRSAVVGTIVGPDGKPVRSGLVLAMPVGAGSQYQSAAHTAADGRFRLTLPSRGVYDLFAVRPGKDGVGVAAVGTLTEATAHVTIHLPSWRGRGYVVVLQQGLAYAGKPVWVWGSLPGKAPELDFEAMPGAQTLRTVALASNGGAFAWSGALPTEQFPDPTATFAIRQGTDLAAAFTFPGLTTGPNGNYDPANVAPYHLAWGSLSEAGGKVRFDVGGSPGASPWGFFPQPDGRVRVPVQVGAPWNQTVAYMSMAMPSQPLLSFYNEVGGPLVPPPNAWLGGFRLSSGRDFPLGLQGAQICTIDMLSTSNGWATTCDNQVLTTSDGGATWLDVTPPGMPNVGPAMVSFAATDQSHAWLAVASYTNAPAVVYYTSNGGQSWQSVATDSATWMQIRFLNNSTGLLLLGQSAAAGNEGVVLLRTADRGAHWQLATDGRWKGQQTSIVWGGDKSGFGLSSPANIWLTGSWLVNTFVLYASHDGGAHWQQQTLSLPQGFRVAGGAIESEPPAFFGTSDGVLPIVQLYSPGQATVFYRTADGGYTWTATTPVQGDVYSVVDADHIVVTDGLKIYRTSDGGLHWTAVQPNLRLQGVSLLDFVSPSAGWAIVGGQLLRTSDGGSTWTNLSAGTLPQK
ncbi:MAG: hypothetical protein M0Z66_13560 [Thermaerobacter sp.]|nr:hypothetical protein [Thermaerobacter sp.]